MAMPAKLSQRLGRAVGQHPRTPAEYATIIEAIDSPDVQVWNDLPADVRTLVEQIEDRPIL